MAAIVSWSAVLGLLCCVWWQPCHVSGQECLAKVSEVTLYVIGKKDESGHHVNTVKLAIGAENGREPVVWTEKLDDSTKNCESTTLTTVRLDVTAKPSPGYKLFPGIGYYKFYRNTSTWMEAKKVCEDDGAHLAIINSKEESGALKEMFSREPVVQESEDHSLVLVGFHDMYLEGDYRTIYGETLESTGFMGWSPTYNSPDNWQGSDTNPGEDCGSMYKDGLLNDIGCSRKIPFICEQELARPKLSSTVCVKNSE